MAALRSTSALLGVVGLVAGLGLGVEWFARGQVESAVTGVAARGLERLSDDGQGFSDVRADVDGLVLLGLVRGRFDTLTVSTGAGVVQEVPIRGLDVRAEGATTDGSAARTVTATVRAEAAGALATQLDDALGAAVLVGTVALPPDRLLVRVPVDVPPLGERLVDVELLLRVEEGRLLVEPVRAEADGLGLDAEQVVPFRRYGVDDELPEGVDVTAVEVVDEDGTAVVVADLACTEGCPFG